MRLALLVFPLAPHDVGVHGFYSLVFTLGGGYNILKE